MKSEYDDGASNSADRLLLLFYKEVRKKPRLSSAEVCELVKELHQQNDGETKDRIRHRIVEGNLRLVIRVAQKYNRYRWYYEVPLLDLIQIGSMGLQQAIDSFNPAHGYQFSTWAVWQIRIAIQLRIDTL